MEAFLTQNQAQLEHLGVPSNLWNSLHEKLLQQSYDLEDSFTWDACTAEVAVSQEIDKHSQNKVWLVRHTLTANSGWQLLSRLKQDFPLLMQVADNIQALLDPDSDDADDDCDSGSASVAGTSSSTLDALSSHPSTDSDSNHQPQPAGVSSNGLDTQRQDSKLHQPVLASVQLAADVATEEHTTATHLGELMTGESVNLAAHQQQQQSEVAVGSVQDQVLASVRRHLHRHVFMYEAQGAGPGGSNMRVRYMLEPLVTRMPVSRDPHVHVMPFMYLQDSGAAQLLSIAWPARPLVCGQPVSRNRLPLGLADYAQQQYWQETYRGETATEEWYGEMSEEVWGMLSTCLANHQQPAAAAATQTRPAAAACNARLSACVLVAGCGNSRLGVDLLSRGVTHVINVDYVQEVIDLMSHKFPPADYPGLVWSHADLTQLHSIPDGCVDLVVDKATLDGMMTADAAQQQRWAVAAMSSDNPPMMQQTAGDVQHEAGVVGSTAAVPLAARYLREMWRVVSHEGVLVIITLRRPAVFQQVLSQLCAASGGGWGWQIEDHVQLLSAYAYKCRRLYAL